MDKLTKRITTPDGQELEYDGSIPKHLDIRNGVIAYTEADVQAAFEAGEIDDVNRDYLLNVLAEYEINPEVIKAIQLYRSRLRRGLKPGQDLFIRMQELGLKHHLELDKVRGIDISGYELPSIELAGAIINGHLNRDFSVVIGNVGMPKAKIGGQVDLADIGIRLKEVRKSRKMKLQAVADLADVSKSLISKIENSHTVPSLPVLYRIAQALRTNLPDIFRGGED